jgi:hypothetical protein
VHLDCRRLCELNYEERAVRLDGSAVERGGRAVMRQADRAQAALRYAISRVG